MAELQKREARALPRRCIFITLGVRKKKGAVTPFNTFSAGIVMNECVECYVVCVICDLLNTLFLLFGAHAQPLPTVLFPFCGIAFSISRLAAMVSSSSALIDKKKKVNRTFLFENYPSRKIALRVAYHGHLHDGLAKQEETKNTIEEIVNDALKRVRLIPPDGPHNFGRCGRTDKGVSALGNCVSFTVRASSWPSDDPQKPPLDYCNMLNNVLPTSIRIIGFAFVEDDFDARFSCISRTYRYYFCHRGLNLDAMKHAAQSFLGVHDFRNFCKMDVVNVSNFHRNVWSVGIYPSELASEMVSYFEITANSFLYHQIRCTMEVLFSVGRGLESPDVVKQLLERGDCKPHYPLADGTPLILWDCGFRDIHWQISRKAFLTAERELQDICTALMIRATAADGIRRQLFRWYADSVDPDGTKVVQRPATVGKVDQWSITGCDLTDPRNHDAIKSRKYQLFALMMAEESDTENGMISEVHADAVISHVPKGYVKLLDRESGRTYEQQVQELTGKKRTRYEVNEAKKAAGNAINEGKRSMCEENDA